MTIATFTRATAQSESINPPAAVRVEDLYVRTAANHEILHGVSLEVRPGTMHGLVGETGSGKSMTAQAIMGLLPKNVEIAAGSISLAGRELVGIGERVLRSKRGREFGMIFQNPRTALNPMHQVGKQLDNVLRAHTDMRRAARRERALEYLSLVGIPDPRRIAAAYPHELSGGLAQRAVIATVLVCQPSFVIADEPTTGLDATVQMQILELIAKLQGQLGLGVLMITHDLGIVAQYCASVSVMFAGLVVEHGRSADVITAPTAAYTKSLIASSRLEALQGGRRRALGVSV
jgi:ABC-type dipeptide/oligopeptide/nickel transport system ATPase component